MSKIVAIAGSLRQKSFNRSLLRHAVAAAERQGLSVTVIDLNSPSLPMMNQDLEGKNEDGSISFPPEVEAIRSLVLQADGILIATPEYNFSIPAPLKNAIDWLSRPSTTLAGKVVALIGASAGPSGTLLAQEHLRTVFAINSAFTLPSAVRVPNAYQNINESTGEFLNDSFLPRIESLIQTLDAEIKLRKRI